MISKKLIEILKLMNNGWELGRNNSGITKVRFWLQYGGCGYGGESKDIHGRIDIYKLINEKFIKSNGYSFPTETFYITKNGKQYLKEIKNDS